MVYGDKRLSQPARKVMNGDLPLAHSTVSFWEIALKRSGKGFDFFIEDDWADLLPDELRRIGVLRVDLEPGDCRRMESLPGHHNDPFDRMLISQALQRRYGILTKDEAFKAYPAVTVW